MVSLYQEELGAALSSGSWWRRPEHGCTAGGGSLSFKLSKPLALRRRTGLFRGLSQSLSQLVVTSGWGLSISRRAFERTPQTGSRGSSGIIARIHPVPVPAFLAVVGKALLFGNLEGWQNG